MHMAGCRAQAPEFFYRCNTEKKMVVQIKNNNNNCNHRFLSGQGGVQPGSPVKQVTKDARDTPDEQPYYGPRLPVFPNHTPFF
jgi:hypothetical protein